MIYAIEEKIWKKKENELWKIQRKVSEKKMENIIFSHREEYVKRALKMHVWNIMIQ